MLFLSSFKPTHTFSTHCDLFMGVAYLNLSYCISVIIFCQGVSFVLNAKRTWLGPTSGLCLLAEPHQTWQRHAYCLCALYSLPHLQGLSGPMLPLSK